MDNKKYSNFSSISESDFNDSNVNVNSSGNITQNVYRNTGNGSQYIYNGIGNQNISNQNISNQNISNQNISNQNISNQNISMKYIKRDMDHRKYDDMIRIYIILAFIFAIIVIWLI